MSHPDLVDQLADSVEDDYRKDTGGRKLHEEAYPMIRTIVGKQLGSKGLQVISAVVCRIIDRREWPVVEEAAA